MLPNQSPRLYTMNSFSARYYNSALSIWISVDPMVDKYPNLSPYTYCANNPVKIFDPDGRDWIINLENNQYVWHDNVTKPSETPDGYRYIGANDNDILRDLNIGDFHQSQTVSRYGGGITGDEKNGAPLFAKAQVTGRLDVSAEVSYDTKNISPNNISGKKFEGVKFEATLIIQSANSNEDASINYNGFFNVAFNNGEKSQVFSTHSGNGIIASGQQQKSATIFFPAKNITNKTYFQSAYISLGSPNPNIINRKIQMDFNLMRTPILKAR